MENLSKSYATAREERSIYKVPNSGGYVQHARLLLSFAHPTSPSSLLPMNSSGFDSGRQFETDPISGQLFFHEPIEGFYSPWRALEPLDYHIPNGPASHSVSTLSNVSFLYLPVVSRADVGVRNMDFSRFSKPLLYFTFLLFHFMTYDFTDRTRHLCILFLCVSFFSYLFKLFYV